MTEKKPFWKCAPDELAEPADRAAIFRVFAEMQCLRQVALYERNGNTTHLWKAWRCARACGPISVDAMSCLLPHLDAMARSELEGKKLTRATQRERQETVLQEYHHLLEVREQDRKDGRRAKTLGDIRKQISKRHKMTPGSVEQLVLQTEGRADRNKGKHSKSS